jgi:ribosome-associated heat shock protein Hsp15
MTPSEAGGPPSETSQRLDKWLWYARVAKSRTIAATAITDGKIKVNRIRAEKASQTIKVGDVVTSRLTKAVRVLRIARLGTRRGPAPEAALLYDDLTPPPEPASAAPKPQAWGAREPGSGRPTKRDRRLTDGFKNEE